MQVEHLFKTKCHNLIDLFAGVTTMRKFMYRLETQALLHPNSYDPYKYVGDGFEFFIELFLKLHPCDNRLGVYNYKPNQINDNGVDGTGLNMKNEPCVVQIKYRSNTTTLLASNKDNLANLFSDGMLNFDVVVDKTDPKNFRHFIFTTADGLHFYTDHEMFKSRVKTIGFTNLRTLLDNNIHFWDCVRDIAKDLNSKLIPASSYIYDYII